MDPIVTIQIPTYRNPKQLNDCLNSLVRYTEFPYHLTVINNDGLDTTRQYLDEAVAGTDFGEIDVIHAGTNLGWMAAHNLALKNCDTPFVCLLNDDVVFLPNDGGFWRKMVQPFSDPSVGAVGPVSNFVMGSQNLWNIKLPMIHESTLLIGFCVIIRTDLLKEIGGLDETLPGGDDFDWSIKIIDAGYKLIVQRSCYLHHIGQQTGRRVRPGWDSFNHQDMTNNALIRRHGVRKWYDTLCSKTIPYNPIPNTERFDEEREWANAHIELFGEGRGLNVGCGNDRIEGLIGVDQRKTNETGSGRQKTLGANPNITADGLNIPMQDHCVDYIVALHVFEHLIDPIEALTEWRRVLKDDGHMVITTPDVSRLDTMIVDYTHVHAFTPQSLTNILTTAGWSVEDHSEFYGGNFGVVATPCL